MTIESSASFQTGRPADDTLLIVGTGALACLFAARLAAAGVAVTLLGTWPEGLEALRTHGVRLVEAGHIQRAYPVRATADPADCAGTRLARPAPAGCVRAGGRPAEGSTGAT